MQQSENVNKNPKTILGSLLYFLNMLVNIHFVLGFSRSDAVLVLEG